MNETPPIDYLVVGHLSEDQTPLGSTLGGTVAFAGLTAKAIGRTVGIVTSASSSLELSALGDISVERISSAQSTAFENQYLPVGRVQRILGRAADLTLADVPSAWRQPEIVHIAPIAREVEPALMRAFPNSFIGLTPQGLMRSWNTNGHVVSESWESAREFLPLADAVVLSIEDLGMDESAVEQMAAQCRILVVTEGSKGARAYGGGRWVSLAAPVYSEVDPTGAGDIFAAVFFSELQRSGNLLSAVKSANEIAAISVSRKGLAGTPTPDEVRLTLNPVGE